MPYADPKDKKAWRERNRERQKEYARRRREVIKASPEYQERQRTIESRREERRLLKKSRAAEKARVMEERAAELERKRLDRLQRKREYERTRRADLEFRQRRREAARRYRVANRDKLAAKDRDKYFRRRSKVIADRKRRYSEQSAEKRQQENEKVRLRRYAKKSQIIFENTIAVAASMETLPAKGHLEKLETLGQRFRAARKALGLSKAEVARIVGIHQMRIGSVERGEFLLAGAACRLADFLGVSIFGDGEQRNQEASLSSFYQRCKAAQKKLGISKIDIAKRMDLSVFGLRQLLCSRTIAAGDRRLVSLARLGDALRFDVFPIELEMKGSDE